MGTATVLANISSQSMNIRAILGAFVCIIAVLAFYNLFKRSSNIKLATYLTIIGTVLITSLILFTTAIEQIIASFGVIR